MEPKDSIPLVAQGGTAAPTEAVAVVPGIDDDREPSSAELQGVAVVPAGSVPNQGGQDGQQQEDLPPANELVSNSPVPEEAAEEASNSPDPEEAAEEASNSPDPEEAAEEASNSPDPEEAAEEASNSPDPEEAAEEASNSPDPEEAAEEASNSPDPEEAAEEASNSPDPEEAAEEASNSPDPELSPAVEVASTSLDPEITLDELLKNADSVLKKAGTMDIHDLLRLSCSPSGYPTFSVDLNTLGALLGVSSGANAIAAEFASLLSDLQDNFEDSVTSCGLELHYKSAAHDEG